MIRYRRKESKFEETRQWQRPVSIRKMLVIHNGSDHYISRIAMHMGIGQMNAMQYILITVYHLIPDQVMVLIQQIIDKSRLLPYLTAPSSSIPPPPSPFVSLLLKPLHHSRKPTSISHRFNIRMRYRTKLMITQLSIILHFNICCWISNTVTIIRTWEGSDTQTIMFDSISFCSDFVWSDDCCYIV